MKIWIKMHQLVVCTYSFVNASAFVIFILKTIYPASCIRMLSFFFIDDFSIFILDTR